MTEKRFEPDEDCHNNQYDYSILNSRYEANIERNEIIEWNKDSCNAQYVGLERIAEKLNFKQMQLEKCHKRYEKLCEKNEQLKKENTKWIVDYNGLNTEYGWLKEEKEQLKKENHFANNVLKENKLLKEKLNEILELTEMTGMIHLRKTEIKSIIKR